MTRRRWTYLSYLLCLGCSGAVIMHLSTDLPSLTRQEEQPLPDNGSFPSLTPFNPSAHQVTLPLIKRKVAFVHVGKAAGNTIRAAFPRLRCHRVVRNPTSLPKCYQKYSRQDSPLSGQTDFEIHMNHPKLPKLESFTTLMFGIRHPATRAISSYAYLHPNNTESVYAQMKHPLKTRFYEECFPTLPDLLDTVHTVLHSKDITTVTYDESTIEEFLEQLKDNEVKTTPHHCQHLAIAVLQGKIDLTKKINAHLRYNYQFYYAKSIQAFPDHEVFALRTESVWEDIRALDVATGGSGVFPAEGEIANENTQSKVASSLTSPQWRDLCCLLWEELQVYQDIVHRASNLDARRKLETLQEAWSSCGIQEKEQRQYSTEEINTLQKNIFFSWSAWQKGECPPLKLSAE